MYHQKPVSEVVPPPAVVESVKETDSQGSGETPSKTVEATAAPPDTEKESRCVCVCACFRETTYPVLLCSSGEKTETSLPESNPKLNVPDVKTESRSPSPQPATRSVCQPHLPSPSALPSLPFSLSLSYPLTFT